MDDLIRAASDETLASALMDARARYAMLDLDDEPEDYAEAIHEVKAIYDEIERRKREGHPVRNS